MRYEIQINGHGFVDHTIKEDGTLVSNPNSKPVIVTHIRVICPGDSTAISHNQAFALFALIMQLHKELSRPFVVGAVSWDEIVAGAK